MLSNKKTNNDGQVMIGAVLLFVIISVIFVTGLSASVYREISLMRNSHSSVASYFTAESVLEDVLYRVINNIPVSDQETIVLNDGSATMSITTNGEIKEIESVGDNMNSIRKIKINLQEGIGVSFNYGVQTGEGGFIMQNTSSISGNLHSNGAVVGSGSSVVSGDVISADVAGLVDGIYATGSVYSHTIEDSVIEGDAHYKEISGTMVYGEYFPDAEDYESAVLPISDTEIEIWELEAESGGVINSPCPYVIKSNVAIGPVKINCDLKIKGNPTVTLTGNVWVNGNITFDNGPYIIIDSSLGGKSVVIVADKPTDRINSGKISVENTTYFEGSGAYNSYVLLVSQNSSSENGGSIPAIEVENSVDGDLLVYAGHGEVLLKNSVNLKEVTAYKVRLRNSAEVIYETGIANLVFSAGPSGGYTIEGWGEVE